MTRTKTGCKIRPAVPWGESQLKPNDPFPDPSERTYTCIESSHSVGGGCMCTCVHTQSYMCECVCEHVCICIYVCVCVYMHACVGTRVCACMKSLSWWNDVDNSFISSKAERFFFTFFFLVEIELYYFLLPFLTTSPFFPAILPQTPLMVAILKVITPFSLILILHICVYICINFY